MRFRPIARNYFWILFNILIWQCGCNQITDFRVSNFNKCWQRDTYFSRIFGISLQRCVEECGKRQMCKGINYRHKVKHCELIPTTTSVDLVVNTIADGPCTSVHRNDIQIQTTCTCPEHEVCSSSGHCSVQECIPFSIINGNFLGDMNYIGARVKFTCDSGFTEANDESTATCLVNGTWSVTPQCNAVCVEPPVIANSIFSPGGNLPGDTRHYDCEHNYNTTNDANDMMTVCLENGSWTTTNFICVWDCGNPPYYPHASLYPDYNFAGTTRYYHCDDNYSTGNDDTIMKTTCEAGGNWTETNFRCYRDCDSLPTYPHSTIYYNQGITTGTPIGPYHYHCHYNYSTDNDNVIIASTCLAGLNWTEFHVTCFRVCGLPTVIGVNSTGVTRVYNCSDNDPTRHDEAGTVNACSGNGTWSATNVTCDWDCGSTLHYPNYSILINYTLAGTTRQYHCDDTYSSGGNDRVVMLTTCISGGNWTETNFTCYRVCGDPYEVANSVVDDGGNLPFVTRQYRCAEGYSTLSNDVDMVTTCLRNGTWSATNFTCDWEQCYDTQTYKMYVGHYGKTKSGKTCQRWDSQIPHSHPYNDIALFPDVTLADASNYCRDPDQSGCLWCYTTVPGLRWEGCGMSRCECYKTDTAQGYAGTWNVTKTGKQCQRWDTNTPHWNEYNDPSLYPESMLTDAANYCRDPDNSGFMWCFTTDPNTEWQKCDIEKCTFSGQ